MKITLTDEESKWVLTHLEPALEEAVQEGNDDLARVLDSIIEKIRRARRA